MYDEAKYKVTEFRTRLEDLRAALDIDGANAEIAQLETDMAAPDFWNDPDAAQKIVQRLKQMKTMVSAPDGLLQEIEDAEVLLELAEAEGDESMTAEIDGIAESIEEKPGRLELTSLLSEPRDQKDALVAIHPGAGGTESCDWADMLYRMLLRFCEREGFEVEILDFQPGDEAGIKSATFRVKGLNAYGNLKSENGVHRLVRISPYDAQSRRHTSFAAVEVLTEVDEDIEVEVRDEDLRMDVFRSSGAGGQHVNKTSSAVRLTHAPSGIVVSCQADRSQHRNRAMALQMLKSKLYDLELQRQQAELDALRGQQQDVAWGSQIRSYVLHPYQMIKDHRTNYETGNVDKTLDGYVEPFVEAYLKWKLGTTRRN